MIDLGRSDCHYDHCRKWEHLWFEEVSDQQPFSQGDTNDSRSPMGLICHAESGSISVHLPLIYVDRLNRVYRSGSNCWTPTIVNSRSVEWKHVCMELATLTTGGISAMVARKSQTIPLRTGSVSVDREPRLHQENWKILFCTFLYFFYFFNTFYTFYTFFTKK